MDEPPPFYDDLPACLAELWRRLAQGVEDRRSPFHTPTLATLGADDGPRARVVVLRAVEAEAGCLLVHCDRRSGKVGEIAARGRAALLGYDAPAKIQIRVEGIARLHVDDARADAAWAAARATSRATYTVAPGPGTPLPAGGAYTQGTPESEPDPEVADTDGRENFAVIALRAERLEFLYLDRRGHRRAIWRRDGEAWSGTWVVP